MRQGRKRSRIWGFGPAGVVLLPVLASLIWTAATGYDLRHQIQWAICETLGWWGLYRFTIALHGHFFALYSPAFSPTALCVVLLALHFAPRRPRPWAYALLALWALIAPAVLVFMPESWKTAPAWFPSYKPVPWFNTWTEMIEVLVGITAIVPLWLATRSRFVAGATLAAVLVLFPLSDTAVLVNRMGTISYGVYIWHAALAAILGWWVYVQRRNAKPAYACQSCGYDLRNLPAFTAACPECGGPAHPAAGDAANAPVPAAR